MVQVALKAFDQFQDWGGWGHFIFPGWWLCCCFALPIHLASGGKDQLQSRVPSLDPLDPPQVSTKRDAMNGHARRQIA